MLQELRSKEYRRLELKEKISQLEGQLPAMEKELFALFIEKHNEQADYENLRSFSVKNWFLDITGKKEALLDKERREAQAAKLKHDTAERQLAWVKQQLAESREEMKELIGCSEAYWTALEEAGEETLLQMQRDRTCEELEKDLECCRDLLEKTRKIMNSVSYLHDENAHGLDGGNMVMPSKMASLQKRINTAVREMDLFIERVSNLGLRKQIVPVGTQLMCADERNWAEVLSRLTRDTVLGETYLALEKAERDMRKIQEELEEQLGLLK